MRDAPQHEGLSCERAGHALTDSLVKQPDVHHCRRTSSPRVLVRPRARRSFPVISALGVYPIRANAKSSVSPKGACGTTGRRAAPAAPARKATLAIHASTRIPSHASLAYGRPFAGNATGAQAGQLASVTPRLGQTGPQNAVFLPRSARDGLCGLLHVGGGVASPTLSRSCELSPGHALGPSARCAGRRAL